MEDIDLSGLSNLDLDLLVDSGASSVDIFSESDLGTVLDTSSTILHHGTTIGEKVDESYKDYIKKALQVFKFIVFVLTIFYFFYLIDMYSSGYKYRYQNIKVSLVLMSISLSINIIVLFFVDK